MIRVTAITSLIILAALWAAPMAIGDMTGKSNDGSKQNTEARATTSASASASVSSTSSPGGRGCEAIARSHASATADGRQVYDSDEKTQRSSGDGCTAKARSSATATSGGKQSDPPQK